MIIKVRKIFNGIQDKEHFQWQFSMMIKIKIFGDNRDEEKFLMIIKKMKLVSDDQDKEISQW